MDYESFFGRKAEVVAKDLLGRYLARTAASKRNRCDIICEITEVGSYKGDLGLPSRQGMLYAPSRLFLMPYRGAILFNIATEREGIPSCVEIRGAKFGEKEVKGSGRIASLLKLNPRFDDTEFEKIFKLGCALEARKKIVSSRGQSDNCLGYFTFR